MFGRGEDTVSSAEQDLKEAVVEQAALESAIHAGGASFVSVAIGAALDMCSSPSGLHDGSCDPEDELSKRIVALIADGDRLRRRIDRRIGEARKFDAYREMYPVCDRSCDAEAPRPDRRARSSQIEASAKRMYRIASSASDLSGRI